MSLKAKYTYNTLTTIVLILLGLNFFSVFKDGAKILRWRLLSTRSARSAADARPLDIREADLILGADSLRNVYRIMRKYSDRKLVVLACASWLILNIAAQVVVAMIQLNASMEDGHDSDGITESENKPVVIPRLDCFYNSGSKECLVDGTDLVYPSIAHAYGEIGQRPSNDPGCVYSGDADGIKGRQNCPYFSNTDKPEHAVRFADYNLGDVGHTYPFLDTNRVLTTSASNCRVRTSYEMDRKEGDGIDGSSSEYGFPFPSQDPAGFTYLYSPRTSLASLATTYMVW